MRYRFENYVFDVDRRELFRGAEGISIEPQVFDLLEYLVKNRDRVVSKDDIFGALWHGRVVSESALTTRINAARSAIGDTGEYQRLIRTLRGKGFRFVGEVREEWPLPDNAAPTMAPGLPSEVPTLPDRPSIAVLPFVNMSGDPEQEYFADGITEDIITALSRVRQFFVIARNSTFQYKGSSPDVRQVASALGVRYVVEGSVRKVGERVRISAQFVDGGTGNQLWAERFDRDLGDVFAIQDEITQSIVGQIGPELSRAEYERTKAAAPENLGAWELFHRGMALVRKRTKDGNEQARLLFERSLEMDTDFASAYAGIAWSEVEDIYFCFADHDKNIVLDHAGRAVALDDKDSFARIALAQALSLFHEPGQAIEEATRAVQINPSFALGHAILGRILVQSGRTLEGMKQAEMAIRLSPSDAQYSGILATGELYLGNAEKAAELARQLIRTFDTWIPWMIYTSALGHLGDTAGAEQARAELDKRQPGFSIAQAKKNYIVFDESNLARLLDGLRKAGVPQR